MAARAPPVRSTTSLPLSALFLPASSVCPHSMRSSRVQVRRRSDKDQEADAIEEPIPVRLLGSAAYAPAATPEEPEEEPSSLLPVPPSRSEARQLLDWVVNCPISVHALVLLALLNVGLCVCYAALLLGERRDGHVMELIAPLGGASILISALGAFALLVWGLWLEEVCTLAAALGVSCFGAVLPPLLVPWGAMGEADWAWPRLWLALAVLALQVALAALGLKPVWRAFCWRSLKRFGCNREAATLRRASLRAWAAQKVDLACFMLQIVTVAVLPRFYDSAVRDVRAAANASSTREVDAADDFESRLDTLNNVFQSETCAARRTPSARHPRAHDGPHGRAARRPLCPRGRAPSSSPMHPPSPSPPPPPSLRAAVRAGARPCVASAGCSRWASCCSSACRWVAPSRVRAPTRRPRASPSRLPSARSSSSPHSSPHPP